MACLAQKAGLSGVVCSPQEAGAIRDAMGPGFLRVVPGIRPLTTENHDQKRVATPVEALKAGASILVIGRPITGSADPQRAARTILESLHAS
jgi:orotidine-5'-phosphate decarboxylase